MKPVKIDIFTFIREKLAEKNRTFTEELGASYQTFLEKKEALMSPNGKSWILYWNEKVNQLEEKVEKLDSDIMQVSKQLHDLSVRVEFDESSFHHLRSRLLKKITERTKLLVKLEETEMRAQIAYKEASEVQEMASGYQTNKYEQALEWLDMPAAEECGSNEAQCDFLAMTDAIETLLNAIPYSVDFEIAEDVAKHGIRLSSLHIGSKVFEPKTYVIRTNTATCNREVLSESDIWEVGFRMDNVNHVAMRKIFEEWDPSFEWFQISSGHRVVQTIFLKNPSPRNEEENFIRLFVRPYKQNNHRKISGDDFFCVDAELTQYRNSL